MSYDFKKIRVLIVDSQPALIELIRGVLQMFGCKHILSATNPEKAMGIINESKPDLLIVDWELVNSDGISFTKTVRNSSVIPYVPIIFTTALGSKKRVGEARDCGITEFLAKPFTAEALYKRIESVVEKPRYFVKTDSFVGPNRRRQNKESFADIERRQPDPREPREEMS